MHISTKHNTRYTIHNSKHISIQYTKTHYSARQNTLPQYTLQYRNCTLHHQYTVYKITLKLKLKFRTKVVEKMKTHILCSITFFPPKIVLFMRYCGKILQCRTGHRWQYYTTHAHCFPDTWDYKYTHRLCNTHCFSTAIMVTLTPQCYVICTLPVMLINVPFLYCYSNMRFRITLTHILFHIVWYTKFLRSFWHQPLNLLTTQFCQVTRYISSNSALRNTYSVAMTSVFSFIKGRDVTNFSVKVLFSPVFPDTFEWFTLFSFSYE